MENNRLKFEHHLKMYLPLKNVIFHCRVGLLEGSQIGKYPTDGWDNNKNIFETWIYHLAMLNIHRIPPLDKQTEMQICPRKSRSAIEIVGFHQRLYIFSREFESSKNWGTIIWIVGLTFMDFVYLKMLMHVTDFEAFDVLVSCYSRYLWKKKQQQQQQQPIIPCVHGLLWRAK